MNATILAYSDKNSVRPGDTIQFMVSAEGCAEYRTDIVRLGCCDAGQTHPPYRETVVDTDASSSYPARTQAIAIGSSVLIPNAKDLAGLEQLTMGVYVWPTRLGAGRQALMGSWQEESMRGYGLEIDARGRLSLRIGNDGGHRVMTLPDPLVERRWQLVGATFDGVTGTGKLFCQPQADKQFPVLDSTECELTSDIRPATDIDKFRLAAWPGTRRCQRVITTCHFDGKLDRPRVARGLEDLPELIRCEPKNPAGVGLIAAWDFSLDIDSDRVSDISGNGFVGKAINLPARAVTGANWTGNEFDWRHAREEYGAVHFHCDDLYDAQWEPDFSLRIPDAMGSGCYAARLSTDNVVYYVPFFVRPARRQPAAKLLFLVPSATYMAYANIKIRITSPHTDALTGKLTVVDPLDLTMLEHPELGLSTYDAHRDGSPVHYSSRLRPVVNCRPDEADLTMAYNNFACDLLLVDWLDHLEVDYDVMTDEDLHLEGMESLAGYSTVMTGTHPEYYSLAMLDALDEFVRSGGGLMYMGGNGFYWRVAFHPDIPGVLEHRRAQQNIARWNPGIGQYFHSFTGEHGGQWWDVGRAPQLLSGIGFIAQGFDQGAPYRRRPEADDPRAAFIFEGVDDDIIGEGGLMPGGNAGIELDRLAPRRGSPTHALVVASSSGHTRLYETLDEVFPGGIDAETGDESVRADMVYFECPRGGAVFSVGSIAYAFGLAHNYYDNSAARIAENVLRRFLS